MYLQLAIRISHSCLSNGYNFKSIGQAKVKEILKKSYYSDQSSIMPLLEINHILRFLPYAIENLACRKYPYVDIRNYDIMKMAQFFILNHTEEKKQKMWNCYLKHFSIVFYNSWILYLEKCIWHPHSVRFRHSKVLKFAYKTKKVMIKTQQKCTLKFNVT